MGVKALICFAVALASLPNSAVAEVFFLPKCIADINTLPNPPVKPTFSSEESHSEPLVSCYIYHGSAFTIYSEPDFSSFKSSAVFESGSITYIGDELIKESDTIFVGGTIDRPCPNGYIREHVYIKYNPNICNLDPGLSK